jgi:hypothetical protein
MKITIEIELGGSVWSWDDVCRAVVCTAGTLSDSSEVLDPGTKGWVFDHDGKDVGQFIMVDRSVRDFHSLEAKEIG